MYKPEMKSDIQVEMSGVLHLESEHLEFWGEVCPGSRRGKKINVKVILATVGEEINPFPSSTLNSQLGPL